MTVQFTITGDKELAQRLKQMGAEVGQAAGGILLGEAHKVMRRSMPQVPFDDGVLKDSATVGQPVISGANASIEFGYGGAAKAYAARQHEELGWHHNIGNAKYLERPLQDHMGEFPANVGKAFQTWLQRRA
jgi:hypothetical protein